MNKVCLHIGRMCVHAKPCHTVNRRHQGNRQAHGEFAVPGCTTTPTGGALLFALAITSSLIGKSYFEHTPGVWRAYQLSNGVIAGLLTLFIAKHRYLLRKCQLPHAVRFSILSFICWGFVVSMAQENWLASLLAYSVYACMVFCLFVSPFAFLSGVSVERILKVLAVTLSVASAASVLVYCIGYPPLHNGRLRGLYNNPLTCGNLALIAIILQLWWLVHSRRFSWIWILALLANVVVIALSKCRSMHLGIPVVAVLTSLHAMRYWKAPWFAPLLCFAFMAFFLAWATGCVSDAALLEAREFARVDGNLVEAAMDRAVWWAPGIEADLRLTNIVGRGFLAAYEWDIGLTSSGYDIQNNRHNTLLSCAQSYGMVGLVLWVSFISAMLHYFWKRHDHLGTLGFVTAVYCVLNGMISNHLLGFGSPIDRISWVVMGLSFAHMTKNRSWHTRTKASNGYRRVASGIE